MKVPDGSHERAMLAWADSWKIKKNFFMYFIIKSSLAYNGTG